MHIFVQIQRYPRVAFLKHVSTICLPGSIKWRGWAAACACFFIRPPPHWGLEGTLQSAFVFVLLRPSPSSSLPTLHLKCASDGVPLKVSDASDGETAHSLLSAKRTNKSTTRLSLFIHLCQRLTAHVESLLLIGFASVALPLLLLLLLLLRWTGCIRSKCAKPQKPTAGESFKWPSR